jgi:hypothetical protein
LATTGPKTPSLTLNMRGGVSQLVLGNHHHYHPTLAANVSRGGFLFCSQQLQAPHPLPCSENASGKVSCLFSVTTAPPPPLLQMQEGGFSFILLWATTTPLAANESSGVFWFHSQQVQAPPPPCLAANASRGVLILFSVTTGTTTPSLIQMPAGGGYLLGHGTGMGNTVCFCLWVCRGMGMALPYLCNTIPLPTGLWVLTASHVADHMMLLITTTTT